MFCSVLVAVASAHEGSHERTAEVVYDLTTNEDGWIEAHAVFFELSRKELAFREMGREPEYTFAEVRFSTDQGPLEARRDEGLWTLEGVPETGPIEVHWRFKPGGMGRHGHQGWMDEGWASFDGRALLLPRGRNALRTMRFRYERPSEWTVVHPWKDDGGWVVAHHRDALKSILTSTCVAVGPFEIHEKKIGETTVRVGAPRAWDAAWREKLFSKTTTLFGWFHRELGFDRRAPFAVAWLDDPDGKQVFGGASVNGACYEHPRENARGWLLLGHRIAHPMNKYVPAGLTLRDERDHWFMEGWASYIEVVGADAAGILPDQRHWNTIYRRYLRTLAREPEHDVPLALELEHGEASEFLHYTKGALVVRLLADHMKRRSGVTLESFMKKMWAEHGFHASPVALREEIAAFTGDDYADFWAVYVDGPGLVHPGWPELVDPVIERRMGVDPVARIGDRPIHPEYLFWLAWSGNFERYADIVDYLERSTFAEKRLRGRGLKLLEPEVEPFAYAFPGPALWAFDQTALAWPLEALPARSGCSTGTPVRDQLVWAESPDATTFQRLLELEAAYEAGLGSRVADIEVVAKATWNRGGGRLGVGPDELIGVVATWNTPPIRALLEVGPVGGPADRQRRQTLDPTWLRTRGSFRGQDRGEHAILMVGAGRDGGKLVARPLWQRQASFTPRAPEGAGPDDAVDDGPDGQDPR